MTRIQRLLGVQSSPVPRWSGWTAPVAMTFAVVTVVLLAVVVVAILIPARQASRIPPVVAFKAEA